MAPQCQQQIIATFIMDTSRIFAVILWTNDNPITGNVLNVSNITQPCKAFSDYCVGDLVKAKCPGFGVHQGVIGMIRRKYNNA